MRIDRRSLVQALVRAPGGNTAARRTGVGLAAVAVSIVRSTPRPQADVPVQAVRRADRDGGA